MSIQGESHNDDIKLILLLYIYIRPIYIINYLEYPSDRKILVNNNIPTETIVRVQY